MQDTFSVEKLEERLAAVLGRDPASLKEVMPKFTEEHFDALYALAYDFYESGEYAKAGNYFHFLTTLSHKDKKHWIGLGASQQMLKEYEKAINSYAIAAVLDQTDPYPSFYAAECCFSMGDIERGMLALDCVDELSADESKFKGLRNQLSALREAWTRST